jgi:hypothetical protein
VIVTHAYVGYTAQGKLAMLHIDDASRDCARQCAKIIRKGGRIERMTVEEARALWISSFPPRSP